jgi:hypothetical protein
MQQRAHRTSASRTALQTRQWAALAHCNLRVEPADRLRRAEARQRSLSALQPYPTLPARLQDAGEHVLAARVLAQRQRQPRAAAANIGQTPQQRAAPAGQLRRVRQQEPLAPASVPRAGELVAPQV